MPVSHLPKKRMGEHIKDWRANVHRSGTDAVESLKRVFPNAVQDVIEFAGETTIVVNPADILPTMQYLRDTAGLIFNYLSDISSVDYWEPGGVYDRPGRFGVSYHLYSLLYGKRLRVKSIWTARARLETISYIWTAANGWNARSLIDGHQITKILDARVCDADTGGNLPVVTRRSYETVSPFNAEESMTLSRREE